MAELQKSSKKFGNIKTMETKQMEIFKTIKNNFASIGFTKKNEQFHTEQLLRTVEGFLAIILQCLYLLFDANTIKDYMVSILTTTVGIFVYVAYLSTVIKTEKIFIFLDDIEDVINESKFSSHFCSTFFYIPQTIAKIH